MPLTHDFEETIRARAQRDLEFRKRCCAARLNAC